MALLPLWFDVVNKRLVVSPSNPDPWFLPTLFNEDIHSIEFGALKPTGLPVNPYFTRITPTGYSLVISVGTSSSILAQQASFTPSSDALLLNGNLALNTAGINALADGATVFFEIKLTDSAGPITFQQSVIVKKRVASSGTLVPIAGDSALGALQAERQYVRKQGLAGERQIFVSQDGLSAVEMWLANDKAFHIDPIPVPP